MCAIEIRRSIEEVYHSGFFLKEYYKLHIINGNAISQINDWNKCKELFDNGPENMSLIESNGLYWTVNMNPEINHSM